MILTESLLKMLNEVIKTKDTLSCKYLTITFHNFTFKA
jgi:hypothetical protein